MEKGNIIGTFKVKSGLAKMAKGGLIMDVVNAEQAKIAQEAGACAVMALERVPADIRKDGGVARMSDPKLIKVNFSEIWHLNTHFFSFFTVFILHFFPSHF